MINVVPNKVQNAEPDQMTAEFIEDLERTRLKALVACDMPIAWQLHAADFQLVTPSGASFTREQYLGKIEAQELHYLRWEPGEITVRMHADCAAVRYQATLQFDTDSGPGTPFRCWHIDLYECRAQAWQVVWSQATAIIANLSINQT